MKRVSILGVRGIPNRYGGFERFVEVLAPYLAGKGYAVSVFCESPNGSQAQPSDIWEGTHRVYLPRRATGPVGTILYDLESFVRTPTDGVALVFGYGTALFQTLLSIKGVPHAVNMDGIEWQRQKWGPFARNWLRINERVASRLSTLLIADHPAIATYLKQRFEVPSVMIPYGCTLQGDSSDLQAQVESGDSAGPYILVIARPEPENQVELIIRAYKRSSRLQRLVIIGNFAANDHGRRLLKEHGDIEFVGPVYDMERLDAYRRHCVLYCHGHSVGGTNPSLIEAMASGALVVAHRNPFNTWVLGSGGLYFSSEEELAGVIDSLPSKAQRMELISEATRRCIEEFSWSAVLSAYESVVESLFQKKSARW